MYDIAIIGGGVNGCGIARDMAGRGLSVLLAEQNDLASGTSSASTKLIHGGLRYLEHYEFGLVRESLKEREVLLRAAPHIIRPMRFVLPHHRGLRPSLLIRLGLFLYDRLGGRQILPASHAVDLTRDEAGGPLKGEFKRGFEYSDCWVDDARLVVLNAVDAAARGADVRVRTEVTGAQRRSDHWRVEMSDRVGGEHETAEARILVNAAGPWVADVMARGTSQANRARVRLVKGSHIVVPKLFDHGRAYIFQNADRRIVFAIPYESDFTLIGTTDVDYDGDPSEVEISADETDYLCQSAMIYFKQAVVPGDVVWAYSGVRPLYSDGASSAQEATRDFVLELEGEPGAPALLNVIGGKITTYRHLAEEAAKKLAPWLPAMGPKWTRGAPLPGGDFPVGGYEQLCRDLLATCGVLDESVVRRLCRAYGTRARGIVESARNEADLGRHFGAGLYEVEVEHLVRSEWAQTADDILWRRSKLGLRLTEDDAGELAAWMHDRLARPSGGQLRQARKNGAGDARSASAG